MPIHIYDNSHKCMRDGCNNKTNNPTFCSRSCVSKHGREITQNNIITYNENPTLCKFCNTPIPYNKKMTKYFVILHVQQNTIT